MLVYCGSPKSATSSPWPNEDAFHFRHQRVAEARFSQLGEILKETMESVYDLPVRLDVDVTIGNNWGEL